MLKKSEKPLIHFFSSLSQRLINYGLVLTVLNDFGNQKKRSVKKKLNEFKCLRENETEGD